jgi:hypothetical protein
VQKSTGFQVGLGSLSVDQFASSNGAPSFAARMAQRQSEATNSQSTPKARTTPNQQTGTLLRQSPKFSGKPTSQGNNREGRVPRARSWQRPDGNVDASAKAAQQNPYQQRPRGEGRPPNNNQQRHQAGPRDGQQQFRERTSRPPRSDNNRRPTRSDATPKEQSPTVHKERTPREERAPPKPRVVSAGTPVAAPKVQKARDNALQSMSVDLLSGVTTTLPKAAVSSTATAVATAGTPRKIKAKVSPGVLERFAGDYSRLLDPRIMATSSVTELTPLDHAHLATARVRGLGPAGRQRALGIVGKLAGSAPQARA